MVADWPGTPESAQEQRERISAAAMTHASSTTTPLIDPFGRAISYLRVSVTDRCDFRCFYCMSEHMSFLPKQDLLTLEELDRLCSAFVARGVKKLRLRRRATRAARHHGAVPLTRAAA
jgi:predicted DNA-binding helix-hairpin-helix protein